MYGEDIDGLQVLDNTENNKVLAVLVLEQR